jgi:hypothetical protein
MRKRRPSTDVFPATSRATALGRALANVSLFPAPTGGARIKSIQPFSITIASGSLTGTATINSVNTTWSFIVPNGYDGGTSAEWRSCFATLDLTNGTTVTATRAATGSTALTIKGMVVELEPGSVKSVQQISITIASSSGSNTQTINSVDTNKAVLIESGTRGGSLSDARPAFMTLVLTNATTVTAARGATTNSGTVTGAVVEFN